MSTTVVTVEGVVRPDGTVAVAEKVSLPAGKVHVTLIPWPALPQDDPFWQMMQRIWDGQKARGHVARSESEVDSEREAMRDEWDARMAELARIQEEADKPLELGTAAVMTATMSPGGTTHHRRQTSRARLAPDPRWQRQGRKLPESRHTVRVEAEIDTYQASSSQPCLRDDQAVKRIFVVKG